MTSKYIVVTSPTLNVRAQMTTMNPYNILRKMSSGEGFIVYETYQVKGMSGLQLWGRIAENPGGITQEYVCLQIGNKVYAKEESKPIETTTPANWQIEVDTFLRTLGYKGTRP